MGDGERPRFARQFFTDTEVFTTIGAGEIGGKAQGLLRIKHVLEQQGSTIPEIFVGIPRLSVITAEIFDAFMERNQLVQVVESDARDDEIALAFQKADLPVEIVGDVRALVEDVQVPLAIRSSSLLEDAMLEPFAGVYGTKMVPNNQLSADARFRTLVEAVKFVYASTYFEEARAYRRLLGRALHDEKMAVIIQEVVGTQHGERFYPDVSGVARSYNFYATPPARPDEGVVSLAIGLGKTIVDGGKTWTYSPAHPKARPPFASSKELLKQTQNDFWVVNMGNPPAYDPIRETEYLAKADLADAEEDDTLSWVASTYEPDSDRVSIGVAKAGPRILTFAPILELGVVPLNDVLRSLMVECQEAFDNPVEIELAVTLDRRRGVPARLGFLQVRPMFVSHDIVELEPGELTGPRVLLASERALGNGVEEAIADVVYVKRECFELKHARQIAAELEAVNRALVEKRRPYLLIVFGRLGSADPNLGIPVDWVQVAGARVIVEARLPGLPIEMSQGSHFFQNITSLRVMFLSADPRGRLPIRWQWLDEKAAASETEFVRHVRLPSPLTVKVDGRSLRGVALVGER